MHWGIYEYLKQVAKDQTVATYSSVAALAALDMGNPDHRRKISEILGEISQFEHNYRRPMLSAVVVHQENKMPGQGFFTLARQLGLQTNEDDLTFFSSELARVHSAWK